MFDIGSAIGHLRLDSSDFVKGMFKSNLAISAFNKIVSATTNFLKGTVSAYIESERVTKQLETVLKSTSHAAGITKQEVLNLASALQQQTNFEDDAIVAADNLLLTFTKIGKNIFPQATEIILDMSQALGQDLKSSAIQVGKALQDPILGVTALRRVGVNFNQEQTEIIKNLVKTGHSAEAQAMILKELQVEFGGSAKAARDTFGGAVKAVQNNLNDLQETLGGYIASAGRPFVENINEMVLGINTFLQSKEGFQQVKNVLVPLTGVFYVVWDIASKLLGIFGKYVGGVLKDLQNGFTTVTGKGNEASTSFNILGGVVKIISTGFAISGKILGLYIKAIADLINAVGKSVDILGAFGAALTDPLNEKKWKAVADKGQIALDAFAKFGNGIVMNIGDIITTTTKEIENFTTDAKINGKELATSFTNGVNDMNKSLDKFKSEINSTITTSKEEITTIDKNNTIIERFKSWADAHNITMGQLETNTKETTEELEKYWKDVTDKMTDAFENTFSAISGALLQSIDNDITLEDNKYKKEKERIENTVTDEEEKKKQLDTLEKDHAKKTAELKKKQFETNKAVNIIEAIMSTARGVAEATAMAYLFPFNFVLAGLIAATGAIQIGAIASQPTPEFAKGTGMGTYEGWGIVGEKGRELVNFGNPTQIFSNQDTERILGGGITQENNFYGDLNTELDLDRVSYEQARKIRRLMRS